MPWARFADDYLGNPKLDGLSTVAIALDVTSIIYSARELRDGHLSRRDVEVVSAVIHLTRWKQAAAELVSARRWTATPAGWDIHDYLEYQPSRAAVLAEREQTHSNKVAAGQAGGVATAKQRASRSQAGGVADAKQKGSPVPGPGVNSLALPTELSNKTGDDPGEWRLPGRARRREATAARRAADEAEAFENWQREQAAVAAATT